MHRCFIFVGLFLAISFIATWQPAPWGRPALPRPRPRPFPLRRCSPFRSLRRRIAWGR